VQPLPRRGVFLLTASPLGEEEPGPEGVERGGYLPIPRRDARAGEWNGVMAMLPISIFLLGETLPSV